MMVNADSHPMMVNADSHSVYNMAWNGPKVVFSLAKVRKTTAAYAPFIGGGSFSRVCDF